MRESSLYIKNAVVVDGSGRSAFNGGILVKDGVIREVTAELRDADIVVDAEYRVLAPGFIDAHSHSDISILAAPEAYGKISQGVTTEIIGNCGLSAFPLTDCNREHLTELYSNYGIDLDWNSFAGYARTLDACRPAVNIASLCGYNTLRAAVAGYSTRELDSAAIERMRQLLITTLDEGACGVSTGLLYVPGKFANRSEITRVMGAMASFNRVYATHLRSEGDGLIEAVNEAVDIAVSSGIGKLHISHLKTAGRDNWHKLPEVLKLIDNAQNDDLGVTADRYPYIESMTSLSVVLPSPYDDMDDVSLMRLLELKTEQEKLSASLKANYNADRWRTVRLVSSSLARYGQYSGLTLEQIAADTGLHPADIVTDLIATDSANTLAAFKGMSHDNLKQITALEYTTCGSDESARPADYSIGHSHPRGFGSFPEFYNLLKDTFPIEAIVAKMTSLPATIFGLEKRGLIAPGYMADMVIFEPDKYKSNATFSNPHRACDGVFQVYVNGELAYTDGKVVKRNGKTIPAT